MLKQQRFNPSHTGERQFWNERLIRDRFLFAAAAVLLAVIAVLGIRFPHGYSLLEAMMRWLGIPTVIQLGNNSKLLITGIVAVIGMIAMLWMLARSLNRMRARIGFLAILLLGWLPGQAVGLYQAWFGEGIYALKFERNVGNCGLQQKESFWEGECSLKVVNYHSRTVQADVTLRAPDLDGQLAALRDIPLGAVDFSPGHSAVTVTVRLPAPEARFTNSVNAAFSEISYQEAVVTDGKRVRNLASIP